jgi:hypothetical protein
MVHRDELLVSAVPLTLRIEPGSADGELGIVIEGFDPITVSPQQRIVIRPEGRGVVVDRY